MTPPSPPADAPPVPLAVDAKGLARMLSLGLRTIRSLDAGGKLPTPVRIGTRKLWDVADVRLWLAAGSPDRERWESSKAARRHHEPHGRKGP
jgi:hypothetical protein